MITERPPRDFVREYNGAHVADLTGMLVNVAAGNRPDNVVKDDLNFTSMDIAGLIFVILQTAERFIGEGFTDIVIQSLSDFDKDMVEKRY
jgi:hypothetical protein